MEEESERLSLFLGISYKFLGISYEFLGISYEFLGISYEFLGISRKPASLGASYGERRQLELFPMGGKASLLL